MVRPRTIDRERVAALVAQGLSDRQIAERLGCRKPSINRVRSELASGTGKYEPHSRRATPLAEQDAAFQARLAKPTPNDKRDTGSKAPMRGGDSEEGK